RRGGALRGTLSGGRVDARPARLLPEQRQRQHRSAERAGRGGRTTFRAFLYRRALRHTGHRPDLGRSPLATRERLRRDQTGDRETARVVVAHYRPRLRGRSEEHTSELQSREKLVCRLLLEKKKQKNKSGRLDRNHGSH